MRKMSQNENYKIKLCDNGAPQYCFPSIAHANTYIAYDVKVTVVLIIFLCLDIFRFVLQIYSTGLRNQYSLHFYFCSCGFDQKLCNIAIFLKIVTVVRLILTILMLFDTIFIQFINFYKLQKDSQILNITFVIVMKLLISTIQNASLSVIQNNCVNFLEKIILNILK